MSQHIKTEPSIPGTLDNPVVIPSDGSEIQAIAQDQHRAPRPSSSTATETESQFPPSWLQLLKPLAEPSASSSSQLNVTISEKETRSVISVSASDSDEEPLMNRRRNGKRAANDHNEETTNESSVNSKRQRHDSGTLHGSMSTRAPASSAPAAFLNPTPASTATYNGLRVVTAPPNEGKRTEIHCRGHMTFEQAKEYGRHGGNCIFQWPLGIGNPFFILVCQQCSHASKDRGYFWTHPFEGSQKAGLKHFGMHMTEWQILEHSGWHVTDAREHFEEILHHNSMLAHKPDKQPPKTKLKSRHSAI